MIKRRDRRSALAAMYVGLALSLAAATIPFVDQATGNVLADHIRAGYPSYSPARIDTAVSAYLVLLSVVGVLGVASWVATIWAVTAGKRWAPAAATSIFALGTAVALTGLLIRDTSGETGLPPLFGWSGILPCLVGLGAVVLLWREFQIPVAIRLADRTPQEKGTGDGVELPRHPDR